MEDKICLTEMCGALALWYLQALCKPMWKLSTKSYHFFKHLTPSALAFSLTDAPHVSHVKAQLPTIPKNRKQDDTFWS